MSVKGRLSRKFRELYQEIDKTEYVRNNKSHPRHNDTNNRYEVVNKINQYVESGMSQEEAIDLIMQDEKIIEKFEYLTKNGLDLRVCLNNWISSFKNTKEYKSIKKEINDGR